jgi:hypothetical protein
MKRRDFLTNTAIVGAGTIVGVIIKQYTVLKYYRKDARKHKGKYAVN